MRLSEQTVDCPNNSDNGELRKKNPAILFLGPLCGRIAWQEAGSRRGCRGDGRGTKELEQTEGEMGVVALGSR